jgi:endogenous inhibitor of DNA gyrase (YacG/DUF329 family)
MTRPAVYTRRGRLFWRRRKSWPTTQTVICPYCGDPANVTEVREFDRAEGEPFVTYHAWCPTCGNDFDVEAERFGRR